MSITTSPQERQQAMDRLAERSHEQLSEDLRYWAVAKRDHERRYGELTTERAKVGDLYQEADAWLGLVSDELAKRRPDAGGPPMG